MITHEQLRDRLLARPGVREAYENPEEDIIELDIRLKARSARERASLTQAEVAERMHTSQQAVARLESPKSGRSPSLGTLIRYAKAVGCDLSLSFRERPQHRS